MKKFWTTLLCAALLAATLLIPMTAFAENGDAQIPDRVLGDAVDIFKSLGFQGGGGTGHGNNQTRIAVTSTGIYFSCPLDDYTDPDTKNTATNYALWRLNADGTLEVLVRDHFFGVAAGSTTNVMVDKEENVWIACSWDEGSGFYQAVAWKYDPKTNTSEKFEKLLYYRKGGGYGKPISIIDPEYNRIYQVALGGEKSPAYMIWSIFDITTCTWGDIHALKTPTSCYYHYAYANGKGGFFMSNERALKRVDSFSNLGHRVSEDIKTFRSNKQNADFMWDEPHLVIVDDATVDAVRDGVIEAAVYDVENGVYPNCTNAHNDVFLDESTGYLYVLLCMDDNGVPGIQYRMVVMDTNQNDDEHGFKVLVDRELFYSYGKNSNYAQHVFKDTTGQLYIIATPEYHGVVEIWALSDALGSEMKLIREEALEGALSFSSVTDMYATIIATGRNNSKVDDTAHLMYHAKSCWYYFNVDFAALRTIQAAQ